MAVTDHGAAAVLPKGRWPPGMERDPEMHQSKNGNNWHFGMKAHVGVDMVTGFVHTVVGTAGSVADVTEAHTLLHGGEKVVLGDAGSQGVGKRPENADKAIEWHTAICSKRAQGTQEEPAGSRERKAGAHEGQRAREGRALLPFNCLLALRHRVIKPEIKKGRKKSCPKSLD